MTALAGVSALEARLRKTAPADWFGGRPEVYAVDGVVPSFVLAPDSPEAVAAVLADASKAGAAVIPRGGGTHAGLGMPPERYDLALDLCHLGGVIDYEPADLTVTVQTGIRLAHLQATLAQQGQWLPLDPPCSPDATVGGILAVNASGPARIAYGTARDLVIGMTVATADGHLVKSGGRVVKNVAGYDLGKMHIGAQGSLGLITQVSLRVAPLPKVTLAVVVPGTDSGVILALAREVSAAGLAASGLIVRASAGGPVSSLLLRFGGGPAAVERSLNEVSKLASPHGLAVEQVSRLEIDERRFGSGTVRLRLVHAPGLSLWALQKFATLNADCESYPTAGVTFAHVIAVDDETAQKVLALRREVEASGGALVVEQATVETKRRLGVWGAPPAAFPLMCALKEQMDPNRILSPGRYVGGI